MGYVVRKISYPRRPWRLCYQTRVGGPLKENQVPETQWRELGIHAEMSLEEVRARVKQLNAQESVKRRGAARQKINARLAVEEESHAAFLPPADVDEFEREILYRRGHDPKLKSHWHCVKGLLAALGIKPEDYEYLKSRFYDHFAGAAYSMSYVQKLTPVINKWGMWQSRKYRLPFQPLPLPTGRERRKISDAYRRAKPKGTTPEPLTPEMLAAQGSNFKPAQFNWLYLSVWFGLRPEEIDAIARGEHFEVRKEGKHTALAVFQTKLTSLDEAQCWKLIPITCREQERGLRIIAEGQIRRPIAKTMRKYFGQNVGLRSGRKNFTDMMLKRGHPLEDVMSWLGHTSIDRTWKNYINKKKLRYSKAA